MEKEGVVSLWVGKVNTSQELKKLLEISYSNDGEFVPSIFARYFNIDRYDDAVREAEFYEAPSNELQELLEGFSYDEKVIEEFTSLLQSGQLNDSFNSVILLYNFKYTGVITESLVQTNYLKYLGTVEYM